VEVTVLERSTVRVRRLVATIVALVAAVWFGAVALGPAAVAQATVAEGEVCPVSGNTAVSSTSGQALICTPLQDNGPAGDLRWRVQTAANTPLDPAVSTTVAGETTTSSTTTTTAVPATAPPTTAAPMPTTGVDSGRWAGEAGILVVTGAVLVAAGRRRRRRGFGVPA